MKNLTDFKSDSINIPVESRLSRGSIVRMRSDIVAENQSFCCAFSSVSAFTVLEALFGVLNSALVNREGKPHSYAGQESATRILTSPCLACFVRRSSASTFNSSLSRGSYSFVTSALIGRAMISPMLASFDEFERGLRKSAVSVQREERKLVRHVSRVRTASLIIRHCCHRR